MSLPLEPQAKRQRTDASNSNIRLPIIDDEATANLKLAAAGFDPNDCITAIGPPEIKTPSGVELWNCITPMTFFCFHGDHSMCRYIFTQGGTTTRAGEEFWYPLYAAANHGHVQLCEWLIENGAQRDLQRGYAPEHRPLGLCYRKGGLAIAKCLILHGAIQNNESEEMVRSILACDLNPRIVITPTLARAIDRRPKLMTWSLEAIMDYACFHAFLMGTFVPGFSSDALRKKLVARLGSYDAAKTIMDGVSSNEQRKLLWEQLLVSSSESPVESLCGHPGVLKCIAQFVGVDDGKALRIHLQMVELLHDITMSEDEPPVILDTIRDDEISDDESDEDA
ncbi:expressed unknown protein [Seminavis robusta]|uniref:Ankyrin repeat protein n=1 Tax=Seminavis robusta TaxID=568900 RepID=A0A9N8F023_9STRA|nr:expressed unknown protein [Seminavis robusta]|eukprot:Sro2386_g325740.1 n/a (337) ;mRNA; r:5611-6621